MEFEPLGYATYYVLMSESYPLAKYEALTLADLKGHKVLTPEAYRHTKFQVPTLEALRKAEVDVSVYYSSNSLLFYAIADGVGVGIYPAKHADVRQGLKRVPLISQNPLEYGLLYRKNDKSRLLRQILERLCEDLLDF